MSKAMCRRYGILLAIIVVNTLASTSITNGYPATALSERVAFDVSQWSWNALWVWAVICAIVPLWYGHKARAMQASMRRHPAYKGGAR